MERALGLVVTKIECPIRRVDLISRRGLQQRLERERHAHLVLVSAPAGFGKTTLMTEWAAARAMRQLPTAWVSLDSDDADPVRFWAHVLTALEQQISPAAAEASGLPWGPERPEALGLSEALEQLFAPRPPEIISILPGVVNALAAAARNGADLALALDDLHLVGSAMNPVAGGDKIWQELAYLVEHLPSGMVVAAATRSDPPLPLARLRARGQLLELRASDLGLSQDETLEFLTTTMALSVSHAQAASLHARTDGWVAGLQLAGLALRSRSGDDVDAFIASFAGGNRYVVDYLAEEVLAHQPPDVVEFLRITCVLDRMTGALCDALTGDPSGTGQGMLAALEQANLFLVPLDDQRRWYRYHPLFGEVLRVRLLPDGPGRDHLVTHLHGLASRWFETDGATADAIEHALAAGELARAAGLIETLPQLQFVHPIQSSLRGWLAAVPQQLVRSRPRLALLEGWRLLQEGDVANAVALVQAAEDALDAGGAAGQEAEANARGEIEVIRGFINLGSSNPDPAAVVAGSVRALGLLEDDNATFRGMAYLASGHGALLSGDPDQAERAFADGERVGRSRQAPHVAVMAAVYLAATQRLRGHYRAALATAGGGLAWADGHRLAVAGRVGLLHLLIGDLRREAGAYAVAAKHADAAVRSARLSGLPPMLAYALLGQARAAQVAGDYPAALAALDEAEALLPVRSGAVGGPESISSPWQACRAQVWLHQGDLTAAETWAADFPSVSTTRLLSGVRPGAIAVATGYEYEHVRLAPVQVWITAARVHEDEQAVQRALAYLDSLDQVAELFRLGWLRVRLLALRALALAVVGDDEKAVSTLGNAVWMAEPEGHVLAFAQEGEPMAVLLTRLRQLHARTPETPTLSYLDRLLAATCTQFRPAVATSGPQHGKPNPLSAPLPTALTGRELEVLALLAEGKSNIEIARTLYVAPSTVKTHVNHIFGKLGVTTRAQAIVRAQELRLA